MTDAELPALHRDRFRGALLGLAIGDAVGAPVEFKLPGTFEPVTDMTGGGRFRLPVGAWTDDTSMALCLAESLLERSGFDPVDQLERYVRWHREGYLSSTGRCFDIGIATRAALERFERTAEPYPGDADPEAGGNGTLMRLAPVSMAFATEPELAASYAAKSARTTHGMPQAIDATRYLGGLIVGALNGAGVSELLHQGVFEPAPGIWEEQPLHPEVLAVAAGSFHAKQPPEIKGEGYAVSALEAALWALLTTRTYRDGVLVAVNLGDDADTTAAIYGQLAGALYGAGDIPPEWLDRLVMREQITALADDLHVLASSGAAAEHSPTRNAGTGGNRPKPDVQLPGDSFWVIEGRLLAGPYPGAPSKAEAGAKLEAFLDAGVTCFVDLTEEGEGPPLHPYAPLLQDLALRRGVRVTHLRIPIADVDVPISWQMRAILAAIRCALDEGETVYVHCRGGVGRTGMVVGCFLIEEGTAPDEVLERLAALRRYTKRAHRAAPETNAQRTFVTAWRAGGSTLVLDQQAIDRMALVPIQDPAPTPVPTRGEVVAELRGGQPVVIEGPGPGWCVQAVADSEGVRVEVLDPAYWGSGPPLPQEQERLLEEFGFVREQAMWAWMQRDDGSSSALEDAADLMLAVMRAAWGLDPPESAGH